MSRSACGLRRIVTLGEYPQRGEAQHHLSSARGPADGICVMGKEKSTLPWDGCCTKWAEHIPPEMCCEEWIQPFRFPKGVCFHRHSAATKRRDEVLTPSMLVRKTDSTERKVRILHSFILLSTCSNINLKACFLLSPTVAAPFRRVDVVMWQSGVQGHNPQH